MNYRTLIRFIGLGLMLTSINLAQSETKKKDTISTIEASADVPGWQVPGSKDRRGYSFSLDTAVKFHGDRSLLIRSVVPEPRDPNNTFIQQKFSAEHFRNKRIRLSAYAKLSNVESANFWLQITADNMVVLNDDRMNDRLLKGSADWRRYDIVMDVPDKSSLIRVGISLQGSGQLWVDKLTIDEVGLEVPVTGSKSPTDIEAGSISFIEIFRSKNPDDYERGRKVAKEQAQTAPRGPVNMDFEERPSKPR